MLPLLTGDQLAALEPWCYLFGGLCLFIGLMMHLPRDFMMPPDDDID